MPDHEIATRPPLPLGVRRKPQLRLALGYRDENRRGAPVKTDYFIAKGNPRAVAKFHETYGDRPRAIDIRLPATLGQFLEIKHLAFAGGQNGEGGILRAVGDANFAVEGTLGGPDVLTVFDVEDGKLKVDRVEITAADHPAAQQLGVQLTTTVTFGIPDVLGFGGICQVGSRGKETTDTLWESAVDIYGHLGPAASLLLRPKLILKESKMLTPTGGRAQVFVLDLYVPESLDEILERAREWREALPARGQAATAMLYGPPRVSTLRELAVVSEAYVEVDDDSPGQTGTVDPTASALGDARIPGSPADGGDAGPHPATGSEDAGAAGTAPPSEPAAATVPAFLGGEGEQSSFDRMVPADVRKRNRARETGEQ